MEVTINLNGIFAKINDKSELRETAQSIVTQIQTAYNARLAELMPKENAPVVVDAAPSAKGKKSAPTKTKKAAKDEFKGVPEADEQKATPTKKSKDTKKSEPAKATKPEKEKPTKVEQIKIASLTKAQVKAMNIKFEQYSEKCMFLTGETKPIKDEIKAIGGAHWNQSRKGWFIKNDSAKALAKALKIKLA